MAALNFVVNL